MIKSRLLGVYLLIAILVIPSYSLQSSFASEELVVSTFSGEGGNGGKNELGRVRTSSMAPDGTLYLADSDLFAVRKFKDGAFSDFIKSGRNWNGIRSENPCGVFAKSTSEIYVSYCDSKSVDLFDSMGTLKRKYLVDVGLNDMGMDWGGGLAVDKKGDIFLSDELNHVIIRIDGNSGSSEIYAGSPRVQGSVNGNRKQATLNLPRGLMVDDEDSLWIADTWNRAIRKIDRSGTVSTVATLKCGVMGIDRDSRGAIFVIGDRECGGLIYKLGTGPIYDDSAKSIDLSVPGGIVGQPKFAGNATISIDRFGNSPTNNIFIGDHLNANLKVFNSSGQIQNTFGGRDGWGVNDSLRGTANQIFNVPNKVFAVEDGSYLVVDNSTVRHLSSTGEILKVTFLKEHCWYSSGVAILTDGTLLCSAWRRIFVQFPDGQTTYIGSGLDSHKDGNSSSASFRAVAGMAVWNGDVYVAEDYVSGYIRKVSRSPGTREFVVSTVIGSGVQGSPTDYMTKSTAILRFPRQIAFDLSGNLFIGGATDYLWKTNLDSNASIVRIPGTYEGSWIMGIATDEAGNAYISTEFGSLFKASGIITRITPEGVGTKNGPASEASFYRPIASFVDKNGSLLIADRDSNLIRKIKVGNSAGYGMLSLSTAAPFIRSTSSTNSSNNNSSGNTNNSNDSSTKLKPAMPSLSGINLVGNKININVNLGSSASSRPDKVYLVAPKLGINSTNPFIGRIAGSTASWSIDFDSLLGGTMIPMEIVAERDGIASDPLGISYQLPSAVNATDAKSVPVAPKNFKSRIIGNSAVISVEATVKSGALATGAHLFSNSLGITKTKALKGDVVGNKALIEVPIKSSMAGKKYPIIIFLTNDKGESKPLNATLSIPSIPKTPSLPTAIPVPKVPPRTVICTRANQTRAFEGENCPPGWEKR